MEHYAIKFEDFKNNVQIYVQADQYNSKQLHQLLRKYAKFKRWTRNKFYQTTIMTIEHKLDVYNEGSIAVELINANYEFIPPKHDSFIDHVKAINGYSCTVDFNSSKQIEDYLTPDFYDWLHKGN